MGGGVARRPPAGVPLTDERCTVGQPAACRRQNAERRPIMDMLQWMDSIAVPDTLPPAAAHSSPWSPRSPSCRCYHSAARGVAGRQLRRPDGRDTHF